MDLEVVLQVTHPSWKPRDKWVKTGVASLLGNGDR